MTRTMSKTLIDALSGLSDRERRILVRLAQEWHGTGMLGSLIEGLAVESERIRLEELTILSALEADERADLDARFPNPEPPAGGEPWWPQGGDQSGD